MTTLLMLSTPPSLSSFFYTDGATTPTAKRKSEEESIFIIPLFHCKPKGVLNTSIILARGDQYVTPFPKMTNKATTTKCHNIWLVNLGNKTGFNYCKMPCSLILCEMYREARNKIN